MYSGNTQLLSSAYYVTSGTVDARNTNGVPSDP